MGFSQLLTALDPELDLGTDPRKFAEKFRPVDKEQMQVIMREAPAEAPVEAKPPPVTITKEPASYNGRDGDQKPEEKGFNWARAMWAMGGGSLSDFDAKANADRQYQLQSQREARAARDSDFDYERKTKRAPLEDAEMSLGLQSKRNANESGRMDLDQKRAAFDPASQYSQTMRQGIAVQLNGFANTLAQRGSPEAEIYANAAKQLEANPNLSVPQMLEAVKPLSDAAGFNLRALHDRATEALARGHLGVAREQVDATRENREIGREQHALELQQRRMDKEQAAEDKKAERLPSGSETTQHLDRREALTKIDRAKQLLASGKVRYLGKGADTLNSIMSQAPDFTGLDKRTPEEKEFASLIQWIAAPQRHELFGSSVTPGEKSVSDDLLASISRNPASVGQSLDAMRSGAERKNVEQTTLYPGLNKLGAPAKKAKQAQPKKAPDKQPGKRVRQGGHVYEQQPDGSYKAVE